jgi:hypothetical protein
MKKIRGDKSIGVITHSYMEVSQGNSLYSHLYLKLKCHVFCFTFSLFSPTKLEEGRTNPVQRGGLAPVGAGRCWKKVVEEIQCNKICTH